MSSNSHTDALRAELDAAWKKEGIEELHAFQVMKEPYISLVRAAFERGYLATSSDRNATLRGKDCPECGGENYYWLRSSGRCTDCNFHWGKDSANGKHPDCADTCQLKEHKGYDTCQRAGFCQFAQDAATSCVARPPSPDALDLAEQWKDRADDAGRLSRAILAQVPAEKTP